MHAAVWNSIVWLDEMVKTYKCDIISVPLLPVQNNIKTHNNGIFFYALYDIIAHYLYKVIQICMD